jgi:hypothetical protein
VSRSRRGSGWHAQPGDEAETVVHNRVAGLEHVPDFVARWHDFRTVLAVGFADEAALIEPATVPAGSPIDLKSCCLEQSNGSTMIAGRWWQSRRNHETLAQRGGYYVLTIYWPVLEDPLVATVAVSAEQFDDLVTWTETGTGSGTREQCAKLSWTSVFDRDQIDVRAGGESA